MIVPLAERPTIIAVSPGRIAAILYESTSECQLPYTENVELPDVYLPRKAYATGTVLPPTVIPDENHPGTNIPLPASPGNYYVSLRSTHTWFNQNINAKHYWQYNNERTYAAYGQPFTCVVPTGTKFYIEANAETAYASLFRQTLRELL